MLLYECIVLYIHHYMYFTMHKHDTIRNTVYTCSTGRRYLNHSILQSHGPAQDGIMQVPLLVSYEIPDVMVVLGGDGTPDCWLLDTHRRAWTEV